MLNSTGSQRKAKPEEHAPIERYFVLQFKLSLDSAHFDFVPIGIFFTNERRNLSLMILAKKSVTPLAVFCRRDVESEI